MRRSLPSLPIFLPLWGVALPQVGAPHGHRQTGDDPIPAIGNFKSDVTCQSSRPRTGTHRDINRAFCHEEQLPFNGAALPRERLRRRRGRPRECLSQPRLPRSLLSLYSGREHVQRHAAAPHVASHAAWRRLFSVGGKQKRNDKRERPTGCPLAGESLCVRVEVPCIVCHLAAYPAPSSRRAVAATGAALGERASSAGILPPFRSFLEGTMNEKKDVKGELIAPVSSA